MICSVRSLGLSGINGSVVRVECFISNGLPAFDIVGLPDAAVKESRDRVRAALKNSGFNFPVNKITVNLAPADVKKEGPIYDLPISLGIMSALSYITADISDSVFVGELSLNGEVRPVKGLLSMAVAAKAAGYKNIYVPHTVALQAAVVEGINVFPVKSVRQLYNHLCGEDAIEAVSLPAAVPQGESIQHLDFADVAGQEYVKRAIEIAAAGGHNIMLIGPPGSGKSMIARRIPSILPDMTFDEAIESTTIHSIAGVLPSDVPILTERPFRSPHHTVSAAALSGGGTTPAPGEISLAHNGVLFLDELPEFSRMAMETLRQPLEDGKVSIARVAGTLTYPCSAMFVAAMNPCPCGYYGHPSGKCVCSQNAVTRYLNKVSGPLLDRIDIHVEVPPVKYEELASKKSGETSAQIKARVNKARHIQQERYRGWGVSCNAQITTPMLKKFCSLDDEADAYLKRSFDNLGMSGRAYDRVLKVARTIADLDESESIRRTHLAQALRLRSLDRKYWNNI